MGAMPKIKAATVKEHRENVQAALVDAAESILRDQGPSGLTAGAVSAKAGIARNSIYRYIDTVDELRGLVLARYLPQWTQAVNDALTEVSDPHERIATWTRANLEQAAATGHGWLMAVARGITLPATQREAVTSAHGRATDPVRDALSELVDPAEVDLVTELLRSLVDAGFRRLDAGESPALVIARVEAATRAVVSSAEIPDA